MSKLWPAIADSIAAALGRSFDYTEQRPMGGGCINSSYLIASGGEHYFVKLNRQELLDMFDAEAAGLEELLDSGQVRAPKPICTGVAAGNAFFVMEYIGMGGSGSMADLGQRLARMHQKRYPYFGWHRDNTIGSTHQPNDRHDDWFAFWRQQRLGFQLTLAAEQGYSGGLQRKGEQLMARMDGLFDGYVPHPSLLHGDLWGGNYGFDRNNQPVIFDPAVYYGDREADLAMTELFGGFGGQFYAAYGDVYPLDAGYSVRKVFYNLYHVLNHLNLFGGGYGGQAERMMDQLLAELR